MKTIYLLAVVFIFFVSSCASVKIFNEDGTKSKGIKVCYAKPYLLVTRTPAKESTDNSAPVFNDIISIVYLPDNSSPQYLKFKSGIGSSDFKFSLENGILTSYGLTTDTKIPETITAVSGLIGAIVQAIPTKSNSKIQPECKQIDRLEPGLYEIIIEEGETSLRRVTIDMN